MRGTSPPRNDAAIQNILLVGIGGQLDGTRRLRLSHFGIRLEIFDFVVSLGQARRLNLHRGRNRIAGSRQYTIDADLKRVAASLDHNLRGRGERRWKLIGDVNDSGTASQDLARPKTDEHLRGARASNRGGSPQKLSLIHI